MHLASLVVRNCILFSGRYIPDTSEFFNKFFSFFAVFVREVIFPTAHKMIFHKLSIHSSQKSESGIDLLANIGTVVVIFDHLRNFYQSPLRLFDREKEFFLERRIIVDHREKIINIIELKN